MNFMFHFDISLEYPSLPSYLKQQDITRKQITMEWKKNKNIKQKKLYSK